ncbi:MAG: hypothetical protein JXB32_00385, partial [Deltaproteobacteria bacterium]|nr:hypothetical protein [Deltaproteobacteria bacterium]
MPRHATRGAFEILARASVVGLLLSLSCDGDNDPGDTGDAEDVYLRCNEEMCTAGHLVCCVGAEPGTWDPIRMGCVCPSHPDADADGDGDVTPDVEPDVTPDVEPDVTPDVEPDVEPDVTPDVEPDVEPDV